MKAISVTLALLLLAPTTHAAPHPPKTKVAAKTSTEPKRSMTEFISAIKTKNRATLINLFARGGVKFVNTSYQKAAAAEKIEFSDLKNQFTNKQGDEYHSLVEGTIYNPVTDGQVPATIPVAALVNAKWTLVGDKFYPAKSQGIKKPQDIWVRWAREGKNWRVIEVALPYPVIG